MNVTGPIRRVSVVSTGQVQIRPDHVASTWRPAFWWLLASRRRTGPRLAGMIGRLLLSGDVRVDCKRVMTCGDYLEQVVNVVRRGMGACGMVVLEDQRVPVVRTPPA